MIFEKVQFHVEEKRNYLQVFGVYSKSNKDLRLLIGEQYLLDRVKIAINKRGEIVLSSTSSTVIREEVEDSFEVESLELSQKEPDDQHKRVQAFRSNQDNEDQYNDYYGNQADGSKYLGGINLKTLPQFQSTKQIVQACEQLLQQDQMEEGQRRLWNFRELLTWKLPEQFCSNTTKNQKKLQVAGNKGAEANFFTLCNQIYLYRLDFVTSRVKEQRVNFCGIVSHVKANVDKQDQNQNHQSGMTNSQIDLESIDDRSRVCLFVKHSNKLNLKELILKDMVLLVKNALRKVSNSIDIYVQFQYDPRHLIVVGQIKEQIIVQSQTKENILEKCLQFWQQ